MTTVGSVTVQGNVSGSPVGARTFGPITIPLNNAVDATNVVALSIGDNTITIPSTATLVVIVGPNGVSPKPNPSYAGVLKFKNVAADTGFQFSAQYPQMFSWDAGGVPASFVINATVATSVECWFA